MTVKVDFHSGVADKAAYCCRLLRKTQAARTRVAVCGPAELLDRLDVALWTFDALSFLPHLRLQAGAVPRPLISGLMMELNMLLTIFEFNTIFQR